MEVHSSTKISMCVPHRRVSTKSCRAVYLRFDSLRLLMGPKSSLCIGLARSARIYRHAVRVTNRKFTVRHGTVIEMLGALALYWRVILCYNKI